MAKKYSVRGKSSSPDPKAPNPEGQKKEDKTSPAAGSAAAPVWMQRTAPWAFWGSLGIILGIALRWIPFSWGGLVFFSLIGLGSSLFLKEGKMIKFFRWFAAGVVLVTVLSAWLFPQLPSAVEGYQPGTLPTMGSTPQEQIAPAPSPEPEIWDKTQFSARGGQLLDKPSQVLRIPEGHELCISELIDPQTQGNLLQRVTLESEAGTFEYDTRMSQCWDIPPGKATLRVGHPEGAEIGKEYREMRGQLPVVRPK